MFSVDIFFVLSLVIISTQGGVSVHNPFYCYSEDPIRQWTELGGIHQPYEPNRGQFINANVSTCSPSKFWITVRHGSRYPLAYELSDMIRVVPALHSQILLNYDKGRTSLCASDFELLESWQFNPNITMEVATHLSASGWIETEALAQRFQKAFPTLLPSTYSPGYYFFRSSDLQRTIYSINAFADGLFGVNGHEQVEFEDITEPDIFLRGYIHCPLYMQQDADRSERDTFIQGPEYQEMVEQVSARLGFHNSNILRNSEVALLALQCRYEQTWHLNYTDRSPICAAFSPANAQVIEYSEDLDWYHTIGYGRPQYRRLLENVVCFQMQDILRFIQSNGVNDHKVRVFNAHVTQFVILLQFDAFAGDAPLTWLNFAQQMHRVWKSSNNLPMTANLAVIRYDCADGDNDVLFLFNEKPLQIPGCDANGVCKQSLILERFSRFLTADCMEIFCTND